MTAKLLAALLAALLAFAGTACAEEAGTQDPGVEETGGTSGETGDEDGGLY